MKKQTIQKIVLLAMPLLVVLIASSSTGVMVFDGERMTYFSWMEIVPGSDLGWCAPVAALMNYVLFGLAVVYALFGKAFCLRSIFLLSLAAACIAVLPIVVQGDVKIIPNAFGAIFLCAQCIAARVVLSGGAEQSENRPAQKLRARR